MAIFGAIEAGGTKFVCGIGNSTDGSLVRKTIATRDPKSTFADVRDFFAEGRVFGELSGLGIASFGPIALDPQSKNFGKLLRTPKLGWEGASLLELGQSICDAPVVVDTDVNAAAMAEASSRDVQNLAYVTVGTGIGVGLISNGQPVHGALHSELGHMLPRRHPGSEGIIGSCPFHSDCLEGLASGTAIIAAWGQSASHFEVDHPLWQIEAFYLGQLCATILLSTSPQKIVFGGGVMKQSHLIDMIRKNTKSLLSGYLVHVDEDWLQQNIILTTSVEPPGLVGAYLISEKHAELS